jgi:aspartyl-tRNA(Asn)/glutamyl-tRNA(Gln) amidotransferase subunit C
MDFGIAIERNILTKKLVFGAQYLVELNNKFKSIMTNININKISGLAKIKILDSEKEEFSNQLETIIDWINILSELNTDNVNILSNVHNTNLTLFNDKIVSSENVDQVMSNTNNDKYNYFTVPKVIK